VGSRNNVTGHEFAGRGANGCPRRQDHPNGDRAGGGTRPVIFSSKSVIMAVAVKKSRNSLSGRGMLFDSAEGLQC
jgi:hypothetical protein